jgi:hypothetical protein
MLSSARPNENTLVIRNYLIALSSAVVLSLGIADAYYQPSRVAHQGRLDNYSRFIGAGVVSYSQKVFAR